MLVNTYTDGLITTMDRFSRRLGPINNLVGLLADRLLPQSTARAGTCVPLGYVECSKQCRSTLACCQPIGAHQELFRKYAINIATCSSGAIAECSDGCGGGCGLCS